MSSTTPSFFDSQPIFILDHQSLDILDVNEAAVHFYGYSRDEFQQLNVNDLGEKKKRVDLIPDSSDKYDSVDKVWIQKTKEGEKIYVQYTHHDFYHNGSPAKIAIAHDVSEQVRHEEKRRANFPKFITHESNFPLAEIEWNADLQVQNWSEKAQELFGWREDEVIGQENFFDLFIDENELAAAKQNLRDAVKEGASNYSTEGKVNTKEGDSLICEWHNSLIYDSSDELHSMYTLVTDISARKESQHLFRTLSEKSLVGVFLIQDGKFQYVNPKLSDIFGYDQQEMIDTFAPHELVHSSDQQLVQENIKERLDGISNSEKYEVKGVTKKGHLIDIIIYGSRTKYRGRPAIVGTVLDVTKDKEIVRKYRASVETFQDLFDSISDAIYIQDEEGRFLEVNQGAVDMYGYKESFFMGKTPEALSAPGKVDPAQMQARIKMALDGKPQNFKWWGKRKNGEVFRKEMSISRGTYFGDDVVITVARDISERYEAEEQLRKSEELFRQLFQNSPIPIALLDKRQEIRRINTAFQDTFGYEINEVKGLDIDQLIVPDEEVDTAQQISDAVMSGNTTNHFGKRLKRDGSLVDVLIYGVPVVVDGKPVSIFGIYVDITDRKQAEERVKKSLKEKEVLLAEIHHRVKNNLAVITGLLELQSFNTGSAEATEVLKESQMRVNSIALIHEKLYQNENLSSILFEQYLEELTEVIVSTLSSSETNISINIEADPIKLTVNQAIPCGLILNEIITNAHKHAFTDRDEGQIDISLKGEDGEITMQILDNGVGIPDDASLENPTSLGLKLIGTLSKQLNGKARFENTDPGTKFTLQFTLEE